MSVDCTKTSLFSIRRLSYKLKKQSLVVVLGIVSTISLAIAHSAFTIYVYGNNRNVIQADAAIVLGAAVWGNKPSPVFRERINHAINLYKTGNVHTLIFTGGVGDSNERAEAIVAKRYAIAQGVLEADILTETTSRTTHQNLKISKMLVTTHQLTKVLIVSDPLHMKRSVLMARNLGMDAYPSPTPTTRYRSLNSQLGFLARETYFYFVYLLFKI